MDRQPDDTPSGQPGDAAEPTSEALNAIVNNSRCDVLNLEQIMADDRRKSKHQEKSPVQVEVRSAPNGLQSVLNKPESSNWMKETREAVDHLDGAFRAGTSHPIPEKPAERYLYNPLQLTVLQMSDLVSWRVANMNSRRPGSGTLALERAMEQGTYPFSLWESEEEDREKDSKEISDDGTHAYKKDLDFSDEKSGQK